jgi:peptidoglycan/xylan/chitin deacetylase (PgdA/CDA1 family)
MGLGRLAKAATAAVFPGAMLVRGRQGVGGLPAAITFDDGPHPQNTPLILAALASADARATFFLQGQEAQRHPELVRAIHRAGHQVANHAFLHRDARSIPAKEFVDEVVRTQRLLCDIVQCDLARDFRPPYGGITPATFIALARGGYRFVLWSKDSRDSFVKDASLLASGVSALQISSGDIVLFHEDYPHTAAALPSILAGLGRRSLRLGTTSELGYRNERVKAEEVKA